MFAALNLNTELFKYVLLVVTVPFWLPFVRAIWEDFNQALRDEGGLLGYGPPAAERGQEGELPSSMVSETHEEIGRGTAPPRTASSRSERAPSRPGFRSGSESGSRSPGGPSARGFRPSGR